MKSYSVVRHGPSTDNLRSMSPSELEPLRSAWRALGGRTPRCSSDVTSLNKLSGVVTQSVIAAHDCDRCVAGKGKKRYQCEHLQERHGFTGRCGWYDVKLVDGPERYWQCHRKDEVVDDLPSDSRG
jgi:hypothetical protein